MEIQKAEEATDEKHEEAKKSAIDETHVEVTTEIGGRIVIDITPKKTKFAKQQQFSVDYTGPDGEHLDGNFIVKRLSIGEQAQVGVSKARMAQSLNVDTGTDYTLQMFATLNAAIIEKPAWFNPTDMFDDDLVIQIYRRCLAFEASFRKPAPKQ